MLEEKCYQYESQVCNLEKEKSGLEEQMAALKQQHGDLQTHITNTEDRVKQVGSHFREARTNSSMGFNIQTEL